jgi:hypothetical protein
MKRLLDEVDPVGFLATMTAQKEKCWGVLVVHEWG